MKTKSILFAALVAAAALCARPATAGEIYVTSVDFAWKMSKFTTSGATANASLITTLNNPRDIAVSGGHLFVANAGNGTIGEYTTSGATVNAALISGLSNPTDIAVSGGNLFVVNSGGNAIGEYTTAGATVATPVAAAITAPVATTITTAIVARRAVAHRFAATFAFRRRRKQCLAG